MPSVQMTDIEIAAILIRKWEGLSLKPYYCPANIPTIGYGHVIPSINYPDITKEQAELWLASDIATFKNKLLSMSPSLINASAHRRAALISFCFNLGPTRYRTSTLKKRVDSGDWEAAKREIIKWKFGGGKVLPGLVARRAEEATLLAIG